MKRSTKSSPPSIAACRARRAGRTNEAQFWADACDDLARMQSRTGRFFPLPEDFGRQDAQEVREIATLLGGGENVLEGDRVSVDIKFVEALDLLADAAGSRASTNSYNPRSLRTV
ncbi:hypothetical protein ACKI1Q_41625 [Streptomyces galilaeus]|uniref:hypothetical protein n=1 Tax=Streptomyces galilaeus TaxID=33899 RepID=UPI0038F5FDFA